MWFIGIIAFIGLFDLGHGIFFPLYASYTAQCFSTLNVKNGNVITGSFEISGTKEEVVVTLAHPNSDVPVWTSRLAADHFKYTAAAAGQYKLCFKQASARGRQTASFQILTSVDDYSDDRITNMASKTQAEKVGILTKQLEHKVSDLLDQQDYAITRESIHRRTAEDTCSQLLNWTIAEVVILISLAVAQMYYLKSTFEIKLIV